MSGPEGAVRYDRQGVRATVTFDRPAARNALSPSMYEQLEDALARVADEDGLRVVVLRGARGTFVAGTDIATFTEFRSGDDGVRYERRLDALIERVETLPVPTVAVVEGVAAGAGLLLAAASDLRLCTPDARFGAPIARTVGNCLSMASTARLLAHFGVARTKALLLTAEWLDADQALAAGFLLDVVAPESLDERVAALCERLAAHAPLTLRATREAIRRIALAGLPDGDDLLREVYGSADFRAGVAAFLERRRADWSGR